MFWVSSKYFTAPMLVNPPQTMDQKTIRQWWNFVFKKAKSAFLRNSLPISFVKNRLDKSNNYFIMSLHGYRLRWCKRVAVIYSLYCLHKITVLILNLHMQYNILRALLTTRNQTKILEQVPKAFKPSRLKGWGCFARWLGLGLRIFCQKRSNPWFIWVGGGFCNSYAS